MPRKGKIIAGIARVSDFPFSPVMAIKLSHYCDHLVLGFDAQGGYGQFTKTDYIDAITWYNLFKKINPFHKSCTVDMFLTNTVANAHTKRDWSIGWLDELMRRLDNVKPDIVLECETDACFSDEFEEELDEFIDSEMDQWHMNAISISDDGRFVPEAVWCEHQRACKWFEGINYNWKNHNKVSPGFCITTNKKYPEGATIFRGKTHLWHFPFFTKKMENERRLHYGDITYNEMMMHSEHLYNIKPDNKIQLDYCYTKEYKKHIDHFSLISCEIDPSNRCHNFCNFCYFIDRRDLSDLSLPMFETIIHQLNECGVETITFTGGGEPLVNPDFKKMALMAFDNGFKIGLITNGILLDTIEDIANRFTFIRVSLDAANPETYLAIKGTHYYDIVVENIKKIIGKTDVGLSFIICSENKHEVDQAKGLAKYLGVKYIQFKPNNKTPDFMVNVSDAVNTNRFKPDSTIPCEIANQTGIINAKGEVYFCCQKRGDPRYMLGVIGNGKSFKEIWEERKNMQPDIKECDTCRYMNYLKGDTQIQHQGFV